MLLFKNYLFFILGRRFAEQDLYVGLIRLIQKYKLEALDDSPPAQEWNTLLTPKMPLPIRFVPRV